MENIFEQNFLNISSGENKTLKNVQDPHLTFCKDFKVDNSVGLFCFI